MSVELSSNPNSSGSDSTRAQESAPNPYHVSDSKEEANMMSLVSDPLVGHENYISSKKSMKLAVENSTVPAHNEPKRRDRRSSMAENSNRFNEEYLVEILIFKVALCLLLGFLYTIWAFFVLDEPGDGRVQGFLIASSPASPIPGSTIIATTEARST